MLFVVLRRVVSLFARCADFSRKSSLVHLIEPRVSVGVTVEAIQRECMERRTRKKAACC